MKRGALGVALALAFALPGEGTELCTTSVLNTCSSGGGSSLVSGTTTISGGTDTQVCYNDAGTLRCGDSGFVFNETTDAATLVGSMTAFGLVTKSTGAGTVTYFEVPALSALTGASNICLGTASCAAATTANQNVVIGANAGDGATTGMTDGVYVGFNAGTGSNIGTGNVAVGSGALDASTATTVASVTAVGTNACGALTGGSSNVCIGFNSASATLTSGTHNTLVGTSTATANVSESIAIGASATITAAQQLVIGGSDREIQDAYIGEGVTNASPSDVTFQATGGSGTDIAGADFRLAGGKGTGTGAGGDLVGLTSPALTTGTTLQTLEVRSQVVAKQFALTDNTAATFAVMTLGNDTAGGSTMDFCVRAKDATNEQIECGTVTFAGVDITAGAGGETCGAPTVVGTLEVLSAGTLAVTFAQAAGTDLCNWRITSDTSLTTTEHYIKYSITHNSGQAVTPQ